MSITLFQQDLKNGMSLNEALQKHGLTFKEAVQNIPRTRVKTPVKTHSPSRNITVREGQDNRYFLRKQINKKQQAFGTYKSLEDAIKVRDYSNQYG